METKHHKTQTRWDTYKHWGETVNHTHSHSLSLRDEILWCYFSQKGNVASLSPASPKFMHLGLEWDHKKFGWNMKIICIIVTSIKPTTGGFHAGFYYLFFFAVYSSVATDVVIATVEENLQCVPEAKCVAYSYFPRLPYTSKTHKSISDACYVQVDKWDLWVCIHKISFTFI